VAVTCKNCGRENRLAAAYCGNCGESLAGDIQCPACETVNPADQNFCNNCGSRLAQALAEHSHGTPLTTPATAVAPSKPVTPDDFPPSERVASAPSGSSIRPASTLEQLAFAGTFTQGLVVAAFSIVGFIRFFGLDSTPGGIIAAEDAFFRVAEQIRAHGWIGLSHELLADAPTGYAYILAIWTGALGEGAGTARLLSAIVSFASIGVFYLLANSLFNGRAALFGALLMSIGLWQLTYGRLALPVSFFLLAEMSALYLLFRASGALTNQSQRTRLFIASGVIVGLCLYIHFAALVLVLAMLALWARDYLSGSLTPEVLAKRFMAFVIPVLIVGLPFWTTLASSSETRSDVKSLLITETVPYREKEGVMDEMRHVIGNVLNTGRALVWSRGGDEFGRGGGRVVDPFTGLLAVVGLLVCVWRWRERRYAALVVLFGVIAVGVGLTKEQGMFGRLTIGVPVVFAFAGIALDWILVWMKGRVPLRSVAGFVVLVAAAVVFFNLTTYYAYPSGKDQVLWTKAAAEHNMPQDAIASRVP
jgi:hypothetical protein